jgi:hypothetical protein
MTLQEIFDKSVTHMLTQGHPSREHADCKYRSYVGACAIGCLFPDSAYQPEFDEGETDVNTLLKTSEDFRAALEVAGIDTSNPVTVDLLTQLQNLHDKAIEAARFKTDIKNGARRVAKEFNLTYNPKSH